MTSQKIYANWQQFPREVGEKRAKWIFEYIKQFIFESFYLFIIFPLMFVIFLSLNISFFFYLFVFLPNLQNDLLFTTFPSNLLSNHQNRRKVQKVTRTFDVDHRIEKRKTEKEDNPHKIFSTNILWNLLRKQFSEVKTPKIKNRVDICLF